MAAILMAETEIKFTFNGRTITDLRVEYFTYDEDKLTSLFIDSDFDRDLATSEKYKSDPAYGYTQVDFILNDKWLIHEKKDKSGATLYTEMVPLHNITHVEIYEVQSKNRIIARNQLDDTEAEWMK